MDLSKEHDFSMIIDRLDRIEDKLDNYTVVTTEVKTSLKNHTSNKLIHCSPLQKPRSNTFIIALISIISITVNGLFSIIFKLLGI